MNKRWAELSAGQQQKVLADLCGKTVCVMRGSASYMYGKLRHRVVEDGLVQLEVNGTQCGDYFYWGSISDVATLAGEDITGIWLR